MPVDASVLASIGRAETAVRRLPLLRGCAVREMRVRRLADRVRIELEERSLAAVTDGTDPRLATLLARCVFCRWRSRSRRSGRAA